MRAVGFVGRVLWPVVVACVLLVLLADGGSIQAASVADANNQYSHMRCTSGTTGTSQIVKCYYNANSGLTFYNAGDYDTTTCNGNISTYTSAGCGIAFAPHWTGSAAAFMTTDACMGGRWWVGPLTDAQTPGGIGALPLGSFMFQSESGCTSTGTWDLGNHSHATAFQGGNMFLRGSSIPLSGGGTGSAGLTQAHALALQTGPYEWHGSEPSLADLPWPTDWYPSGAGYVIPDPSFCGYTITIENPTSPDALLAAGNKITYDFTSTTSRAGGVDIQYVPPRWGNDFLGGPWYGWINTLGPGDDFEVTVQSLVGAPGGRVRLKDIRVRCFDLVDNVYRYLYLTEADETATENNSAVRPCLQAKVAMSSQTRVFEAGDDMEIYVTLNLEGSWAAFNNDDIEVSYAFFDPGDDGPVPPLTSLTWTALAPIVNDAHRVEHWTVEAEYDGLAIQLQVRCEDLYGFEYGGPWASGNREGLSGEEPQESCISGGGLSLHPSTWVPVLVSNGKCMLQELVIPKQSSVDNLNGTMSDLSERAPIAYLTVIGPDLYNMFDEAPATVTAHRGDSLLVLPGGLATGVVVEIEPGELGSDTEVTALREKIGIGAWVGYALLLLGMTRKLLSK